MFICHRRRLPLATPSLPTAVGGNGVRLFVFSVQTVGNATMSLISKIGSIIDTVMSQHQEATVEASDASQEAEECSPNASNDNLVIDESVEPQAGSHSVDQPGRSSKSPAKSSPKEKVEPLLMV